MAEHSPRKLAVILHADVVGSTTLVQKNETLAHERIQESFRRFSKTIESYGGTAREIRGDALVAEFGRVSDSVCAAIAFQLENRDFNTSLEDEIRPRVRIGIAMGEVVIADNTVTGEGVVLAQRLEQIAEPGGVCIQGAAYETVPKRLPFSYETLGEQTLKGFEEPVRAYEITLKAGETVPPPESVSRSEKLTLEIPDKPSIAVLAFTNMSGDPEQEYFSDGLTEDIITALTHWRSFPVIARNSSFAYKDKSVDIIRVGQELGARYLLEGSVRKGADRVRISAQLIDAVSSHHIWAERYDRELADVFEVQDEIVQRITATVTPELVKAEVKRSTSKRPEDLDAWDYWLRGMAQIRERTPAANAKARELFKKAIAIQHDYSDAYAGIARSHNHDASHQSAEYRMETAKQAMNAAREAVKYDGTSSRAHHELSTAYQWLNRHDDALAEVKIAVDLNPNDAVGLHALGNKSDLAGEPDGISFMEKAQRLNPEDAQHHGHLTFLARAYLNAGAHDDAIDRARQAIRRSPEYAPAYYILAIALGRVGRRDEARRELSKCDVLHPGFVESRRNWQPYVNPESNEKLRAGLRQLEI